MPLTEEEQKPEELTGIFNDVDTKSPGMPEYNPVRYHHLKYVRTTWTFGGDWFSEPMERIGRKIQRDKLMYPAYDMVSTERIERLTGL